MLRHTLICTTLTSILLTFASTSVAQPIHRPSFAFSPASETTSESFSWNASFSLTVISPGGTLLTDFGSASFPTFEEFLADVVGVWQVFTFSGDMISYEILPFEQDLFPLVDLLFPCDGDFLLSGQTVQAEIFPSDFSALGQSISHNGTLDIDFPGPLQFIPTLEGVDEAEMTYRARGGITRDDLITSIMGDLDEINLEEFVLFWGNTQQISLTVVSEILIGDINRDGVVNLLDVAPFVTLLSDGKYQIEADINSDGLVNLQDVSPFVDLLTP